MDSKDHQRLINLTAELREYLAQYSTRSVAGWVFTYDLRRLHDTDLPTDLVSPARQCSFLLGQLLSSEEPLAPRDFGTSEWKRCTKILNRLNLTYMGMYWPKPEEMGKRNRHWNRVRQTAMGAFLEYFNSGMLASTHQVLDRISRYLCPFDSELKAEFGLSATEAIKVAEGVARSVERSLEAADESMERLVALRDEVLDRISDSRLSLETIRGKIAKSFPMTLLESFHSQLDSLLEVSLDDLVDQHGRDVANAFWRSFTIARGEVKDLVYLTQENPIDAKPIIRFSENRAYCPRPNAVLLAIHHVFEAFLTISCNRDRFFRKRDVVLEDEVQLQMKRLFPDADILRNVYEEKSRLQEHDLLILCEPICIVVECKASPPVEPFRDPEKAFTRISRHFKSDRGIQKAYDQGRHLWRRWASGETISLFNSDGTIAGHILREKYTEVFLLCVTRESYGLLATDLSLLLDKNEDEPYPWAINILDLEAIADAWAHFHWNGSRLIEYLRIRTQLHERVTTSDELEIVGYLIAHGSLEYLRTERAAHFGLDPNYSGVFDSIYLAMHANGPPVTYDPKPPVTMDLRASLQAGQPVLIDTPMSSITEKVGRNEPCPCGSGRKYKRCCGRPPRK